MLQTLRANTSDLILRLLQRKLLDKNAEFTQEEIKEAALELDIRIQLVGYSISRLRDDQEFIKDLLANVPKSSS